MALPHLLITSLQSITTRRWQSLALFTVPLLVAVALVAVKFSDIPWSSVSQSGGPHQQQPIVLQVVLILLPLVAIGAALRRSRRLWGKAK